MNWIRVTSLICLLFTGRAVADSRPQLQISVGDWPPYLSSELRHEGEIAHLISAVFGDEGYRVSFRFLPWPRAYSDAAAGKFDATGVWMHKRERKTDFLFSAPLLDEQLYFQVFGTPPAAPRRAAARRGRGASTCPRRPHPSP